MDRIGRRRLATTRTATLAALIASLSLAASAALIASLSLAKSAEAQAPPPRYEPVDCFESVRSWAGPAGVECAWLVVPQLRERPELGTMRLAVVRMRAREPDGSPPLVYLHGGPGGEGAVRSWAPHVFAWPTLRHRDVVVYDQRGAGLSEPRPCPEVVDAVRRRWEAATVEPVERWDQNARDCVSSLRAQGVEARAFTTRNNVLDLIDLRRALGYARWDLYGVSYGGALAQEAIRQDGGAVRAAVLTYSSTPGPTMQAESALAYQRSLEHLFAACADQAGCRAAFPALGGDFFAVYRALEAEPAEVTIERPSGSLRVQVDGDRYLREMRCRLSDPSTIALMPQLVREILRGDQRRALAQLAQSCRTGGLLSPTFTFVICDAMQGEAYRKAAADVRGRVRAELKPLVSDNAGCKPWQEDTPDALASSPLASDVPTLLLTGEFDDRAPTSLARRIASGLSRAWVFELPGESHGGAVAGCHAAILFQFLGDPSREPDAACLAEMPLVVFETTGAVPPR